MNAQKRKLLFITLGLLAAFGLWTAAVCLFDVQTIGPQGSAVGLAAINGFFHKLTGVHMALYTVTDWLGLVPIFFMLAFAILGLVQWISRKNILKVDHSILVLGGFYILVLAAFLFFEAHIVNYRPVLIEGFLEASYPSSTTLLVLTVLPTAALQLKRRIARLALRRAVCIAMTVFTLFMLLGRTFSGVHWLSDIIGGILLSAGLVMLYVTFEE